MRKSVLVISASLLVSAVFSQSVNSEKKYFFGFNIGAGYSNLIADGRSWEDIHKLNGPGVNMGVLMDYKINNKFSLSPQTGLSFYNSRISYLRDNARETHSFNGSTIDIASILYYRMASKEPRPFFSIGPAYKIPLKDPKDKFAEIAKPAPLLIIGLGLEKQLSHLIFSPELRYSIDLSNLGKEAGFNMNTLYLLFNFK